jgi:hypothetical protein
MPCCNKQDGCNKQEKDLPKDALLESLSGLSVDLVGKLLQVAAAGLRANILLRQFGFADTKAGELAKRIADLASENEYLRRVTDMYSPVSFNSSAAQIEICFGYNNEYALKIPLTSKSDRMRIITQLITAADKLARDDLAEESDTTQQVLPFCDK